MTTPLPLATHAATTVSRRLADRVATLQFDDLPPDVVNIATLMVLDQVGLQVRGATLDHVQPVLAVAERLAGIGESTVTGATWRTTAPHAAWVNGTLGHSAEFDDAHALAWHVSSSVASAVLAVGEAHHRSGRDAITALVSGHQVMALLGAVTGAGMQRAGWHGSKVLGVFGAAAAAGKLLELTPEQLANAFGIAASDAGGTMEYDQSGGEVKRLHAGSAARIGIEAALLAQAGFTGPATIFEGPRGVFPMFGGTHDIGALDAAWDHWHIRDTIFRLYPAVATVHGAIAATEALAREHRLDRRDVTAIRVGVAEMAVEHGGSIVHPTDGISAQFSLAFSVALALVRGRNLPQYYFDPSAWCDPEIRALSDLVEVRAMPIPVGEPVFSSRVDIELRNEGTVSHHEVGFPGHPVHPATPDQLRAKFDRNVDGVLAPLAAKRLAAQIGRLATLPDVAALASQLGTRLRN